MSQGRAIVVVLDGCGAGAAPDASSFGDSPSVATVRNVWDAAGGLNCPHLASTGFLRACGIADAEPDALARYGRLRPLGMGKDSVTGHWELMGVVVEHPFPTYPDGFPESLVHEFETLIARKVLGNKAASGTEIIRELGEEHVRTGRPILYTSADSVFQIACHEQIVPIEELYAYCRKARQILREPHNVQRVIARPFVGDAHHEFRRTEKRKDFPVPAPHNVVDDVHQVYGIGVVPELFAGRGFRHVPRTQSNAQHAVALWEAMESDARFIFANFEDFDMLYGHRNDPAGFARCLEEFDPVLGALIGRLGPDDLLVVTADHGNDPTDASTDHTREYLPFAVVGAGPGALGDLEGGTHVGDAVLRHLGIGERPAILLQ